MRRSIETLLDGTGIDADLRALPSFCTANEDVLRAMFEEIRDEDAPLLIEATSNQVNQFGGYTGFTPSAFIEHIHHLAEESGVDPRRVVLGGDHLGPNPWTHMPAGEAMSKACAMVASYAAAGFHKIHLDASMPCADDTPLGDDPIAERAARLCASSEGAATGPRPVYVIGTEVPTPGGRGDDDDEALAVTHTADIQATIEAHREAFHRHDIDSAWDRVIAVVVQPGVEFGNHAVTGFDPEKAADLPAALRPYPGLSFEAHSTDYQSPASLTGLVEAGFAFLKVGPALTFAFREAVIGLVHLEPYLETMAERSSLLEIILDEMRATPRYWQPYYHDTANLAYEQLFSLSDRIRYYWAAPRVRDALQRLFANVEAAADRWPLLHQYFPDVDLDYVRSSGRPLARELVRARVARVVRQYMTACR